MRHKEAQIYSICLFNEINSDSLQYSMPPNNRQILIIDMMWKGYTQLTNQSKQKQEPHKQPNE